MGAVWSIELGSPAGTEFYAATVWYTTAVATRALIMFVLVWLVAALRRLRIARVALADEALAAERRRLDGELRRTVGAELAVVVERGTRAGGLVRTDTTSAAAELRELVDGTRRTLAAARRFIARYKIVSPRARLDTAAALLRTVGIEAHVEISDDDLPDVFDDTLDSSLRSLTTELLRGHLTGPVLVRIVHDNGSARLEWRAVDVARSPAVAARPPSPPPLFTRGAHADTPAGSWWCCTCRSWSPHLCSRSPTTNAAHREVLSSSCRWQARWPDCSFATAWLQRAVNDQALAVGPPRPPGGGLCASPLVHLELDSQWCVMASAAMLLRGRLAVVAVATPLGATAAIDAFLSATDRGEPLPLTIWTVAYWLVAQAVIAGAVVGAAQLVRAVDEMYVARAELAELDVGNERVTSPVTCTFAGGGVDDPDVEVVDEHHDALAGVGAADADVVHAAGSA